MGDERANIDRRDQSVGQRTPGRSVHVSADQRSAHCSRAEQVRRLRVVYKLVAVEGVSLPPAGEVTGRRALSRVRDPQGGMERLGGPHMHYGTERSPIRHPSG